MSGVEGFAALPNWMVRDQSVSVYALMVYIALASHSGPGGIHPSQTRLAAEARCSERKVRDAIAELRELGVVEIVRRRRTDGKATTMSNGYVLHPNGNLLDDEEPAPDAGSSGKLPAQDDEATGTSVQLVPLTEEEPIKKTATEYFDEFWVAYPRHVAKEAARKAFAKVLKVAAADVIVAGARAFAADPNLPEKTYVPYPASWLNAGRWDDEPLPARDRPVGPRDLDEAEEWMRR